MTDLIRHCRLCGVEKRYKNKVSYKVAVKKDTLCSKCAGSERKRKEDEAIERTLAALRRNRNNNGTK